MAENPRKCKYVVLSDEQLKNKKKILENDSTVRQEKRADTSFRQFLAESGEDDLEYDQYTLKELDHHLGKFWFGLQNAKQEKYKVNTLQGFKYGINRVLKKKGLDIDITKDPAFANSQACFKAAILELKEEGLGVVNSAPEINEDGTFCYFHRKKLKQVIMIGKFKDNRQRHIFRNYYTCDNHHAGKQF